MLVCIYLQHFLTVFVQNKCSFIYFSNIFLNRMLQINIREGLFSAIFWNFATNKRLWRLILSNFMNGLLKINVPQFIFLALLYIFAQNTPLFTYFSCIFLKIVLIINIRLSLFRCHVCTVVEMHALGKCLSGGKVFRIPRYLAEKLNNISDLDVNLVYATCQSGQTSSYAYLLNLNDIDGT